MSVNVREIRVFKRRFALISVKFASYPSSSTRNSPYGHQAARRPWGGLGDDKFEQGKKVSPPQAKLCILLHSFFVQAVRYSYLFLGYKQAVNISMIAATSRTFELAHIANSRRRLEMQSSALVRPVDQICEESGSSSQYCDRIEF